MTEAEFEALPEDIRFLYPTRSWGPSHSNYYMCEILFHCQNGGTLSKQVWEGLGPFARSFIQWAIKRVPLPN